jgi:argininosuccinate lyase
MATLWKQAAPLHPTFDRLNRCLREDWFLLPFELRLQAGHAAALEAAGILTAGQRAELHRALDRIGREYLGRDCPDSDAEDLHTWVESALTAAVGEAGRMIHTARSRNDQVATLLRMYCIDAAGRLEEHLRAMISLSCRRAARWCELAFPLQTHAQFAAPGTIGFWLLRYATAWERSRGHLRYFIGAWRRHCPLGSGAVAGSSIPIDRRLQAAALGFDGPSPSALDSTSGRDDCLEFLALAAQVALHLQAFAADVIAFSQTPLAWTRYPPAFATGSSMMPNKLNPDAMELLRGEASGVAAAHGEALVLLKGLPSGYNRDLQCIKPLLRRAADRLLWLCEMTAAFLEQLDFDPAALEVSTRQGQIGATLRMEELVLQGTPLREAHHAIATDVQAGRQVMPGEARDWITRYRTAGSASPAETRRVAAELLEQLKEPG